MQTVTFIVYGEQKSAGSKKAYPFRKPGGGLGVRVVHDNTQTRSWMQEVAHAAQLAMENRLFVGPVSLTIVFERPRPKGHFGKKGLNGKGKATPYPVQRPDTVKLTRAVEDALTRVVWRDDSQVVIHDLRKVWSEHGYRTMVTVREVVDEPY